MKKVSPRATFSSDILVNSLVGSNLNRVTDPSEIIKQKYKSLTGEIHDQ